MSVIIEHQRHRQQSGALWRAHEHTRIILSFNSFLKIIDSSRKATEIKFVRFVVEVSDGINHMYVFSISHIHCVHTAYVIIWVEHKIGVEPYNNGASRRGDVVVADDARNDKT